MENFELNGIISKIKQKILVAVCSLEYGEDNAENVNNKTTPIDNDLLCGVRQVLHESIDDLDKLLDKI